MAYYSLHHGATAPLKPPKRMAPTPTGSARISTTSSISAGISGISTQVTTGTTGATGLWKELQPGNVELADQFPEFCLQPQRPSGLNIDTKLAASSASVQLQLQLQHLTSTSNTCNSTTTTATAVTTATTATTTTITTTSSTCLTSLGLCTPPSSPVSSPAVSRLSSPVSAAKAEADPVPVSVSLPVERLQTPLSLSLPRPRCASDPQRSGRDKEESRGITAALQRSEKRRSSLGTKALSQSPTHSKLSSPPRPPPKPAKFSRQPRPAETQSQADSDLALAETKASTADQRWITVQEKTFTKWLNTKIVARNLEVKDLVPDLSDGVMLIHLLECLSHESLGRYASRPKLRVQKFENANLSLDFIRSRGIQMTNIGAEDVVDGNRKIVLGLIWTLILRFTISDINEEGMSAKEGLLLWCQRKTACYDEVEVRDFSSSWNNGLAFCALLDIHRPDLIDFDTLDKSDHRGNMQLAFDIAYEEIGIPKLLDVEDVCDVAKPDERSLMTYIAYWFHAFSQMEKVENAGRRVEKFFNNMQGAWEMQNAYERRMRELLKNIRGQVDQWHTAKFEGTYADAKAQAAQFSEYKRGKKREWVAEKSELATLLGNIKTKLSTYRLRPYEPPHEVSQEVIERDWKSLTKSEMARAQLINETIRDIKNALRKSFADKANDFAMALNTMQLAISGLDGDIEDQLHHVKKLSENLAPLDRYLSTIAEVDAMCEEANIEENDFTTYTYDELAYELTLVRSSVQKKLSFLENQMVARNMTNLTPIQLEEFESVFRHFDRDASNSLQELEFSAALASLGLVFSEEEMHDYFVETSGGKEYVTFEQFIRFMVDVTEDQNTAEQVFQSFREVADGKPYVTEMDLRHSLVPEEVIDTLLNMMPPHSGPDMSRDRGKAQYDYISFMEKMMGGEDADDDIPAGVLQDSTNSGDARPRRDSKAVQHLAKLTSETYPGLTRDAKYASLTAEDVAYFKNLLGGEQAVIDGSRAGSEDDLKPFNEDWMHKYRGQSRLVLKPGSTEEVSQILRYCNDRKLAVVPQGGNTGLVGGSVPIFDEIIINMSRMNQIHSFDEVSGSLVLDAGCILEVADQYLAERGYIFPLDLGAKGSCHVGGTVATNAGGLRLLRYGSLHGNVLGMEAVLPDGTVMNDLCALRKNNTGYDLKQLFIGGEGTIGIITKLVIQCPQRSAAVNVAYFGLESYEKAQLAFREAKKQLGEILSAFELMDSRTQQIVHKIKGEERPLEGEHPFYCLIETSGSNGDHDYEKLEKFLEDVLTKEIVVDGVVAQGEGQAKALWSWRESITECIGHGGGVYKYDVSIPLAEMYSLVEDVKTRMGEAGLIGDTEEYPVSAVVGYGHMGDSNLHLNVAVRRYDAKVEEALEPFVYEWIEKRNGSISAEHGLGLAKKKYVQYSRNETVIGLMKQIKKLYDPNGIMNPYKYI
ncbi:hypothetical protein TrVFT333_005458 [Trichoderma virens FT-333]|nr:hypothetical protein TrVFT333_005458 [Trichoderma virens FT-333]